MAKIYVHIGKNIIDDELLNSEYGVNIIIEKLKATLALPKPQPTPYNLWMTNQTIAKPLCLIHDLRILVHGILYNITFMVMQNNVIDCAYSMFLN